MIILQNLRKSIRGELTSLIRIEYGRRTIARYRFLQGFFVAVGIKLPVLVGENFPVSCP